MSRSKGNRIVRERAIPFYENLGFDVERVERVGRYREQQDLYADDLLGENYTDQGFDLVLIHPLCTGFVQVKTNSPPTQKWYKDFAKKYCNSRFFCQCFTWYDRDGIRVQDYTAMGNIRNIDLRKSKFPDAKRVIWFTEKEAGKRLFPNFYIG